MKNKLLVAIGIGILVAFTWTGYNTVSKHGKQHSTTSQSPSSSVAP